MFVRSCVLFNRVYLWNYSRLSRKFSGQPSYLHNPGCEPLTYSNMGKVLEDTVNKYPNRVAIKSIHEDLTITYEELLSKVLINPSYEISELGYCINKAELKGLVFGNKITSRDYYGMLQQMIPELSNSQPGKLVSKDFPTLTTLVAIGNDDLNGIFKLKSLANEYRNNNRISEYVKEINPGDGSIIHFTSGTTGKPKAGLDSHLGLVNNTYFSGLRSNFRDYHQKICVQVPMFHALGSVVTVMGGLRHGCTLILASPVYSVQANINALCSERCTAVTGTPTMYVDILSQIRDKGILPIKLQMAMAAGAPCSPQLIRQMQKQMNTASVSSLYGMTETTASNFQSLPDDSVDKVAEHVGYIQDHVEAKVVDENGKTVPFGESGELMIRGYVNMISYWNDPEKTKETINEEGWLHTGDKFKLSPDGYGTIVGRIKEIIVRGGENIAPKEIEDLLNTHPDIVESQVIGVADERLGEELCAVLRIREGAKLGLDEIKSFCSGKMAKFKIPRIMRIVDSFPKTASGKIQKFRLKEMMESGKL
ncbi:medium-chain acyl-CoA ligase ACSF2, mitochondrial isoform X2 [Leptidea sinapis]|uniref:medium-chain acyl-CoA ligase ACSF2, mitochondrial isoform X2 n=1 Tax=Leptidea sinapis TaxID=189913 RepID=UPI0021C282A1|nr:medium-chain acyl-CoA ligase ACSF2, mitochondrial isoform X2 [Leptidea sinapis]